MEDAERTARLAAECERELNNTEVLPGRVCAGTFDGWVCWGAARAPSVAAARCPAFVPGFSAALFAHKECLENGSWWRHPLSNKPWSNYTTCVAPADDISGVITVYEVGYSVSLVCLLLSLAIILHFKSLRCPRMLVHCHLFAACALNNALWLAWYALVVRAPATAAASPAWCRALHAATHYALLATYSWALCEGLYLHAVLVRAFVHERRLLRALAPLGWLAPAPFALYGAARRALAAERLCWLEGGARWELLAPAAAALLLNALVLANVLRVLCGKLRGGAGGAAGGAGAGAAGARTLRAACLLAPLLGLQYLLLPARPGREARGWLLYEYCAALGCGLQGAAVAALYCFCNGEVHAALRRRLAAAAWLQRPHHPRDARDPRSRANSNTNTTVSFVRHAGGGGGGAGVANGGEGGGGGAAAGGGGGRRGGPGGEPPARHTRLPPPERPAPLAPTTTSMADITNCSL